MRIFWGCITFEIHARWFDAMQLLVTSTHFDGHDPALSLFRLCSFELNSVDMCCVVAMNKHWTYWTQSCPLSPPTMLNNTKHWNIHWLDDCSFGSSLGEHVLRNCSKVVLISTYPMFARHLSEIISWTLRIVLPIVCFEIQLGRFVLRDSYDLVAIPQYSSRLMIIVPTRSTHSVTSS